MANFEILRPDVWSLFGDLNSHNLTRLFRALVSANKKEHVCLLLDSYGGDVEGTLGFVHEARKRLEQFEIRVVGQASSAAVFLIQAATPGLRTAVPSATFMTHSMFVEVELKPSSSYSHAKVLGGLNQHAIDLLSENSQRPASFWKKHLQVDYYFDAQRALSLGLIDEIV